MLDVTAPLVPSNNQMDILFEMLCDPSQPLADPRLYREVQWDFLLDELLRRCKVAIEAIIYEPAVLKGGLLRVAGAGGLFCLLRFIEFSRRVARNWQLEGHSSSVTKLRQLLAVVLPKEMWRRWVYASIPLIKQEPISSDLIGCFKIFIESSMKPKVTAEQV